MVLIIGRIPPPIGGVTIYVSRLVENLKRENFETHFLDLSLKSVLLPTFIFSKFKVIHLIASHPIIRFYFSVLCLIGRKRLIITYTDNLGEFTNLFYNFVNITSVKLSNVPVLLNNNSFQIGYGLNSSAKLISSFIPPATDDSKIAELQNNIHVFLNGYDVIFCTNAFDVCFDQFGKEMYGIMTLIEIFNVLPEKGLIISDPSGNYKKYIYNHNIILNENIILISNNKYNFLDVIKSSNCLIRATTTDGDSISIHEALYLNKDVICSNCVNRPEDCILYVSGDVDSLRERVNNYNLSSLKDNNTRGKRENGLSDIMNVYNQLLLN